jgi:hypothetical protein
VEKSASIMLPSGCGEPVGAGHQASEVTRAHSERVAGIDRGWAGYVFAIRPTVILHTEGSRKLMQLIRPVRGYKDAEEAYRQSWVSK